MRLHKRNLSDIRTMTDFCAKILFIYFNQCTVSIITETFFFLGDIWHASIHRHDCNILYNCNLSLEPAIGHTHVKGIRVIINSSTSYSLWSGFKGRRKVVAGARARTLALPRQGDFPEIARFIYARSRALVNSNHLLSFLSTRCVLLLNVRCLLELFSWNPILSNCAKHLKHNWREITSRSRKIEETANELEPSSPPANRIFCKLIIVFSSIHLAMFRSVLPYLLQYISRLPISPTSLQNDEDQFFLCI